MTQCFHIFQNYFVEHMIWMRSGSNMRSEMNYSTHRLHCIICDAKA